MLEVERRRRKVLEQATGKVKGLGTLRKGRDWQQGQSQHSGGAGGADVPLKMPPLGQPARAEDELMRAHRRPFERPLAHLGHGFYSGEMLRPEPSEVTSSPDMRERQVLTNQGCQWHAKAHNGPAPGKT